MSVSFRNILLSHCFLSNGSAILLNFSRLHAYIFIFNNVIIVVTVTPSGPLYIAMNTERIINCSISEGPFNNWGVMFRSNVTVRRINEGEIVSGINIIKISTFRNSSSLIVNTTDTSIIGLECSGGFTTMTTRISLTIYGMLINYYRAQ